MPLSVHDGRGGGASVFTIFSINLGLIFTDRCIQRFYKYLLSLYYGHITPKLGGGSANNKIQFLPQETYPNTNNIHLMTLKLTSLAWTASQNCALIFSCLPNNSPWVSNRQLKLKMSKARLPLFPNPHQPFSSFPSLKGDPTL